MTATADNAVADLRRANAELQRRLDEALAERDEALERETATAEVLQVIKSSPGDLAPVFDAILYKALHLCEAAFGVLWTHDGEVMRPAASRGVPLKYIEFFKQGAHKPGAPSHQRLLRGERFVQVANLAATERYRSGEPLTRAAVDLGGVRTILLVPLRNDAAVFGHFGIYRQEVRPFSDKQIALLQNFAAQAVIAMENARLITETREALDQRTATAEVLQVINSSPGDLAPVFDAMLEKAMRLCEAAFGTLASVGGAQFHIVAQRGVPAKLVEYLRKPYQAVPGTAMGQFSGGEQFLNITDLNADPGSLLTTPRRRAYAQLGGARSILSVPLRKDETLLGALTVYRQEVRPFSDKQIALLQNFAAQAVIAMENARLLGELQQRTSDLQDSLEYQTASSNVLKVISRSTFDLQPVFETIVATAVRLCDADDAIITNREGDAYRLVASFAASREFDAAMKGRLFTVDRGSLTGRTALEGRVVQIHDIASDPEYTQTETLTLQKNRTMLGVPLLRERVVVGTINLGRTRVQSFTERQIELVRTFADQAVIALENARLITEQREALEQQTATAEVLEVINNSPGDLAPVFDAMLEKAMHLCEAAFGVLWTYDGERLRAVAMRGVPRAFEDFAGEPLRPGLETGLGRVLRGERLIHIADIKAGEAYRSGDRLRVATVELAGARTLLLVPLRKDDALLGIFSIYRQEVRPFTDKQIALLQNFAAQAVIAMENARLITETQEALEQQTATAEVLQVINSSPGDLAPVFDAMLEKATRLCEASLGLLRRFDGEVFRAIAVRGVSDAAAELFYEPIVPDPGSASERLVRGEAVVHIPDVVDTEAYRSGVVSRQTLVKLTGARTALWVALRKDDALLGDFVIYRKEVRPFTDKQIALLQYFAAQAVIAMENARLITETREALDQQTATAEVLGVINSSPGDLAPVFDAMLDKAIRLCEAGFGILWTYDGERFRAAALRGVPAAFAKFLSGPIELADSAALGDIAHGRSFVHVADLATSKAHMKSPLRRATVDLGGARTGVAVPLQKDDALLGIIVIYRQEVRPFSDKQIALLRNFAAQAVIAMENVRLITELRESLKYQTATSDVLKVVSRSTFDLQTVLQTVVVTAIRLCRADSAVIYRNDDGEYRWAAGHMLSPEYEQIERNVRIRPGTGTVVGRAALEGRSVQILDAWTDPLYEAKDDAWVGNVHTMIGVPLLREGATIGVIGLARRRVEAFSEREIQLVTTFADQAVIAIENARLFNELRQRTHDLQESLEYQTASSDVLKVISQSGAELGSVLDTLVETAARICRAESGFIFRLHDGLCRMVASFGIPAEYKEFQTRNPIAPGRGTLAGRTALERRAVHIEDAAADPEYTRPEAVQLGRQRTMLGVPLVREDALIGVITLARTRVEPFTEKQIGLVTTFADQAVIAIENARLFNELRERTAELGRSVEELKMLSEVGQAVSSTLDLRSVLSTILNASLGVTWANAGAVFRYSRAEHAFRLVEAVGWDEALAGSVRDLRIAENQTAMGEAVAQRAPIQLADLAQRASYPLRDIALAAGFRSVLIVPLVGAERIFGAIILMRQETGEFPPEAVRLMQTLASQSVLAIQNARLFREIADKSEQLALASQHKSQFLANMSHELRTPLNAILGYAELLVDGIYGQLPDRPKGVLERIQNNGKHLLALINDVLDLAKIEAGQLTLTLEDYALAEVVRSVVTATEPLATSKGLKFTTALQDDMPTAHGDARRVSQVLLNLVGNAIKFTEKGEVEIRAAAERSQFVLTVRDTGPGIADPDHERIFGEFQQIDNSNTRRQGGTGLGLAISKRMVEMQGGTISVDSVLGQGSTFRVVLPVHVDEAMEEAA